MSLVLQEISKQYITTNNGLEQVYQNKLVEGVDFERWNWLEGDGQAFIKTNIKCTSNVNIEAKVIRTEYKGGACIVGARTQITDTGKAVLWIEWNNAFVPKCLRWDIGNKDQGGQKAYELNTPYVMSIRGRTAYLDGNSVYTAGSRSSNNLEFYIFGVNHNNKVLYQYSGGAISYVKIGEQTFSPVKLLAPCPPNLSANGKPYPIGECGMIDSVSGKFYGNSGSGSFSVYNDPVTE